MEHAPKAQKKEYFMPGATYFMNRFFMLGRTVHLNLQKWPSTT